MLSEYREVIKFLAPVLVDDPSHREIKRFLTIINPNGAPILAAASNAGADFLVTLDKKHFIGKNIHVHSDMKIVTPGEFLKYFRESL